MPRTCQPGKVRCKRKSVKTTKQKEKNMNYPRKIPQQQITKGTRNILQLNDLRWRYQPTSTLSAKYEQSSRQVHARLCSFYAIQPASTLPAYALPALLAGKCLCNPAGKCIARLLIARITRRQIYMRSSRQVHCPPTRCPHYSLANVSAIQPASALPAYALLAISSESSGAN